MNRFQTCHASQRKSELRCSTQRDGLFHNLCKGSTRRHETQTDNARERRAICHLLPPGSGAKDNMKIQKFRQHLLREGLAPQLRSDACLCTHGQTTVRGHGVARHTEEPRPRTGSISNFTFSCSLKDCTPFCESLGGTRAWLFCLFWRRFAPARCASFTFHCEDRRDCASSLCCTVCST